MRAVEISLRSSELSKQMAAMRIWLDERRFEPSSFACRDTEYGVLVSLEFKSARHAEEFAKRFDGRAIGPLAAEEEATGKFWKQAHRHPVSLADRDRRSKRGVNRPRD